MDSIENKEELYFPHETIRESQKELTEKILEAIKNKKCLLANAPTGLGKTAASISAALTYALKNNKLVIFITPKHTQHKIAVETIKAIKNKHNLNFVALDLIGKRHLCAQPGSSNLTQGEFSEYCKEAVENKSCHYYNNIKEKNKLSLQTEATLAELKKQTLHVEELKEQTSKAQLCPYEMAILVAKEARIIIADYHHILNPSIRDALLKRIDKDISDLIIIFDESHNLPSRSRELLSSKITNLAIEYAAKEARNIHLEDAAEDIIKVKEIIEKTAREKISFENKEALTTKQEFITDINKIIDYDQIVGDLLFIAEESKDIKKKSFAKTLAGFLINWQGPDEAFVRIIEKGYNTKGKPMITLSYSCLDPALLIKPLAEQSHSSIFMSGTLNPIEMYKDLFSVEASLTSEFKSPFPKNNKLSIIIPDTTTKFTARTTEMYERIAKYCAGIVNIVPGNTAIFFPSYDLRDKVNGYLTSLCNKTTLLEIPKMTKQEKEELLDKFKKYEKVGSVLLAATSGSFGEGVDFANNMLKCVIVVGIPLDRPDLETQELIKYYDKKFGKGWDYGYTMPAIIKCLQNAGRCIRSETDKGVIIYLDQRYIWESYFKCFPKDSYLRITKEPLPRVKEFFENNNT